MAKTRQFTFQINADASAAQKTINELGKSLEQVTKISFDNYFKNSDFVEANKAAKDLATHLQQAVNVDTGKLNLVALNKSLTDAGQSLTELSTNLLRAGSTGQDAFLKLATAISQSEVPLKKMNATLANWATTLKNTVKWEISSTMVHGLESAFSGAVNYAKDLNSSLTNIRIVTGQTIDQMAKFTVQANQAAKSLSTTTKAYADASLIYYQQGDNAAMAAKKAEITLKAANASFNTSAAEMSEYLTAVWNSYQVGADQLERYVDIMATLGAKTATSLEEIATSMQKVAATSNTVGVSMEQVSSIIATVSSVTRESAESIGTSYKTIFARMGDLKLGKTDADGIGLGQVSSQLQSIGVQVLDASGNLRDMGDIITDLGNKWQTMNAAQKTAVAQVVAGKRQYTQLMALFENWDMYNQNLGFAQNSSGALQGMQDVYAESWEAASKRVQASLESIYNKLINDQAIISFTNSIADAVEVVDSLVNAFGGLPGILGTVGMLVNKIFSTQISTGISTTLSKMGNYIKQIGKIIPQREDIKDENGNIVGTKWTKQNILSLAQQQAKQTIAKQQKVLDKQNPSTDYEGMVLENSRTLLDLKTQLIDKENSLNTAQKERASSLLNNLTQEYALLGKISQETDELENSLITTSNDFYQSYIGTVNPKTQEVFNTSGDVRNFYTSPFMIEQRKLASKQGKAYQLGQNWYNQLQQSGGQIKNRDSFIQHIDFEIASSETNSAMETMFQKLKEMAITGATESEEVEKYLKEMADISGIESTMLKAAGGQLSAEQLKANSAEIERSWQTGADIGKSKLRSYALEQSAQDTKDDFKNLLTGGNFKNKSTVDKIGEGFSVAANAAMSLTSSLSIGASLISTLNDESASLGDKMISVASTVGNIASAFATGGLIGGAVSILGTLFSALQQAAEEKQKDLMAKAKKDAADLQTELDKLSSSSTALSEQTEKYKSLKDSYSNAKMAQSDYISGLSEITNSLALEGTAVALLTGDYKALEAAIESTTEARLNDQITSARETMNKARAGAGNALFTQYESSQYKDASTVTYDEGKKRYDYKSVVGDIAKTLNGNQYFIEAKKKYKIDDAEQLIGYLLGANGDITGVNQIGQGFTVANDYATINALNEHLADLVEQAENGDQLAKLIVDTAEFKLLQDTVSAAVVPAKTAQTVVRDTQANLAVTKDNTILSTDSITELYADRQALIDQVLAEWAIDSNGIITDTDRVDATKLVNQYLMSKNSALTSPLTLLSQADANKAKLIEYGKIFSQDDGFEDWFGELSPEDLIYVNPNEVSFEDMNSFINTVQTSAKMRKAQSYYSSGQTLLEQYDTKTMGDAAAFLASLNTLLGTEGLDTTQSTSAQIEYQISKLRPMVAQWGQDFNANKAVMKSWYDKQGSSDMWTTDFEKLNIVDWDDYQNKWQYYNKLYQLYGATSQTASDAYTPTDVYETLTNLGMTQDQMLEIIRQTQYSDYSEDAFKNGLIDWHEIDVDKLDEQAVENIDWKDVIISEMGSAIFSQTAKNLINQGLDDYGVVYDTYNYKRIKAARTRALELSGANLAALTLSDTSLTSAATEGMTKEQEEDLQTQLKLGYDAISKIDFSDALNWDTETMANNMTLLQLTDAEMNSILRGNQAVGIEKQISTLKTLREQVTDSTLAATYDETIEQLEKQLDKLSVNPALIILESGWTNVKTAAEAASTTMKSILSNLSSWATLSGESLLELQANFNSLGLSEEFTAYQTAMNTAFADADNVNYEQAGLASMKAMTQLTLAQNAALTQQQSLYQDVSNLFTDGTITIDSLLDKSFTKDTTLEADKLALLDKVRETALTNLGYGSDVDIATLDDDAKEKIQTEIDNILSTQISTLTLQINANVENLKSDWSSTLTNIYAQEQATAQEVYNIWVTTFEAISEARKGLASGQSIIETLYGNPEKLKAIIAQMREAGIWDSDLIHKALNDNTYDASKLKMDDFDVYNYGKTLHATGDALMSEDGYIYSYLGYMYQAGENIKKNGQEYIKSLTDEQKEQLVKDGILTASKDDKGNISYTIAEMDKFIAKMLMTEKEHEKAVVDLIAQKEIKNYQDKAAEADIEKAKRDKAIADNQEIIDEAAAMRDAANKAWQDKAAGTSITDSLRASNVNLEEFAKLAGVSFEDLDKLTFDQLDAVAKAQQGIIETSQASMKTAATNYQTTIDGLELTNTQYGEEAEQTVENIDDKITTFSNKIATDNATNIKAMADAVGMTKDEFEAFAQQIELNDPNTTLGNNMYEVAYITAKASKALSEFDSSANDLFKTLKKGKKDTNEYIKAMSSVKKYISDIFNVDEAFITDDVIEANMDNLDKLVNGTEEEAEKAAEALQDALMDKIVTKDNIIPVEFHAEANNILNQVNGILDGLAAQDVAIGTVKFDTDEAIKGLNTLLASGQITADGITAALNGIGWQPQIEWEEHTVTDTSQAQANGYIKVGDTYERITGSTQLTTGQKFYVPTIKGAAKTGSGISTPNLGSSGKGGGGGGGGKPEKLDTKDPVDEKERYHEINKDLDNLAQQLEKVDKAKTATYGGDHLKELQKEIDLLEEEGRAYQMYLDEAEAYLASDKAKLEAEGAIFDADGDIDNYDELIDSWVSQYNAFIEKYNASSASQQEGMKEEKEDWDEWYEDRLEMIEKYEESLDTVLTQENNILQNRLDLSAAHLEGVQYKIEYQVEINDDELAILEYFDELYEEIVHKQGTRMSNLMTQATQYEDNLHILGEARKELDALYAAGELTDADYVSGLRDINEQVIENLESLEDVKESITELYEDTLELIDDELEEQEKHIESAADAMESYLTLMGLMGRGENYRELEQFYEKQAEFMFANLQNEKSHLDFLMSEKEYYDNIIASGRQLSELEQEQYDALLNAIDEANEELLQSTEEMLQLLEDKYKNTVSAILDELDTQLAGMQGLDHLAEQFSYFEEEQERYVTSARELYEVSKLNRQINDSIASNTSKASKEMLRQLRERINAQSELNDLTEYDIEMYQLQYELALRKIALEEAQNAKDTIRLTRDENGNMVYQYTANEDKISQAQQDYEDTLQEINDLTANRINELYSLRIEAMQQLEDDLEEIANNTQLSEEERNQLMAEAQERFAARIAYVSEQYTNASENFAESNAAISAHYGEELAGFAEQSRATIDAIMSNMAISTTETMLQVQNAIGNLETAWKNHVIAIADVSVATGTSYEEMVKNVDKYSNAVENAKKRNDEFIKSLGTSEEGLMAEIHNASEAWNEYAVVLQGVVNKYQAIIDTTAGVIAAIAEVNGATEENKSKDNKTANNGGTPTSTPNPSPNNNDKGGGDPDDGIKIKGYKIFYNGKQLSPTMYDTYAAASQAIEIGYNNREAAWRAMPASGQYYAIAANEVYEWDNAVPKAQYLHGGLADFTGPAWLDGTKSDPELVLNATDTQNMLATVSAIRDLDLDTIMRLRETIDLATMSMLSNLQSAQTAGALGLATSGTLDQTVTIHAEFPNVQDKNEIMDAIDDLVNRASQYSQKKMS